MKKKKKKEEKKRRRRRIKEGEQKGEEGKDEKELEKGKGKRMYDLRCK